MLTNFEITINEPDKLLEFINGELKPKEKEKKENGEVFTPLSLVNEMLDKLDEAYIKEHGESIFKEEGFRWLDPAVGIGNFPIIVYQRLMKGLVTKFQNEEDRRKHILEQMIYSAELTPKNVFIYKQIFCCDKYKLNIYEGNTLKMDFKKAFKLLNDFEGFDIILGNPPYNPPKTETGSSGNSIWQNFVMKSFEILKDKGYLCLVHPSGWKKPTDKVFNIDKFTSGDYSKQIRQGQVWRFLKEKGVFMFIYTNDQNKKKHSDYLQHFPAVDFYVYQKEGDKHNLCNTKNVFLGKVILLNNVKLNYNLDYLPNLITTQTQEILHKITAKEGDKADFKRFRASNGFSQDHSKGQYKYFYTVNSKKERQYQYSNIRDKNIDINKVVMNWQGGINTYYVSYIKSNEKLGAFDKVMYSKVNTDKEGIHLELFFKSNIVKFIFLITQYASGMRTVNEHLVANSITIPPEEEYEYYKFFDIEDHKDYIEDILSKINN